MKEIAFYPQKQTVLIKRRCFCICCLCVVWVFWHLALEYYYHLQILISPVKTLLDTGGSQTSKVRVASKGTWSRHSSFFMNEYKGFHFQKVTYIFDVLQKSLQIIFSYLGSLTLNWFIFSQLFFHRGDIVNMEHM